MAVITQGYFRLPFGTSKMFTLRIISKWIPYLWGLCLSYIPNTLDTPPHEVRRTASSLENRSYWKIKKVAVRFAISVNEVLVPHNGHRKLVNDTSYRKICIIAVLQFRKFSGSRAVAFNRCLYYSQILTFCSYSRGALNHLLFSLYIS